jgi:hypothetical protein
MIPRKASDEQAVRVRHLPQKMKGERSLTTWYNKKYPPQGGIGFARLTIHDQVLNDVRVVLPTGYDAIKT